MLLHQVVHLLGLLFAVVAVVAVAASPAPERDMSSLSRQRQRQRNLQPQMDALESAKGLWESAARQGSPTMNYTFAIREGGQNLPVIVEVRDDVVVKAVRASYFSGGQEGNHQELGNFFTVEGYFDWIQTSMDSPDASVDSVSYDATYGYPKRIVITSTDSSSDGSSTSTTTSYTMDSMLLSTVINRNLNAAKSLWESQNISSYDYTVQVTCFCNPDITAPHVVQVRDNVRVAVVSKVTDQASEHPNLYPTIPGAFGRIEEAVEKGYSSVTVSYDRTYGFPTRLSIDENSLLEDESSDLAFSDFSPRNSNDPFGSTTRPPIATRPPRTTPRPTVGPYDEFGTSSTTGPPSIATRPPITPRPTSVVVPSESPSESPSITMGDNITEILLLSDPPSEVPSESPTFEHSATPSQYPTTYESTMSEEEPMSPESRNVEGVVNNESQLKASTAAAMLPYGATRVRSWKTLLPYLVVHASPLVLLLV